MALRPILIASLLIFLLAVTGLTLYPRFHRPVLHHLDADLQWLGVVDLGNSNDITLQTIKNGEDGVLVVDHAHSLYRDMVHKIPQVQYLTLDELFNPGNWHLFDKDGDGLITAKDPLYKHLFIIKFHPKEDPEIKPLAEIGIRGIDLSHHSPKGGYLAQMNDGSQRVIMSTSQLEKS